MYPLHFRQKIADPDIDSKRTKMVVKISKAASLIICFITLIHAAVCEFLDKLKYIYMYSLAHTLLLNVFSALKGTHFFILFVQIKPDLNILNSL